MNTLIEPIKLSIRERLWQKHIMPLLMAVEAEAKERNFPFKWEMRIGSEVFYYECEGAKPGKGED